MHRIGDVVDLAIGRASAQQVCAYWSTTTDQVRLQDYSPHKNSEKGLVALGLWVMVTIQGSLGLQDHLVADHESERYFFL